jgi:predicted AAA+ superfamily ATPase
MEMAPEHLNSPPAVLFTFPVRNKIYIFTFLIRNMKKEIFKKLIVEWSERELPETMDRELKIDISGKKIVVVTGVRRAGKTYLLFSVIKNLIENKHINKRAIIYINFEDERLGDISVGDLEELTGAYYELYGIKKDKGWLFVDEIQNVEGWEKWIRRMYDSGKYNIFVTGSNSKFLSAEISTSLSGRNLTYIVYPFSFREFILAKSFVPDKTMAYSEQKTAVILRFLDEYLVYGGFPEVSKEEDVNKKIKILSEYYNAIFFRDIIKRFKIRDVDLLDKTIRYSIGSFSQQFSVTKIYSFFKTIGVNASKKTINSFIRYAKEVFLLYQLFPYFRSIKKRLQTHKKLYIVDTGMATLFDSDIQRGRLLENLVYIELLRRKEEKATIDIGFWKDLSGKEVDFVVTGGGSVEKLIQCAYSISDNSTKEREKNAILGAMDFYKLDIGYVITWDYEAEEKIKGRKIKFVPLWKWLLDAKKLP